MEESALSPAQAPQVGHTMCLHWAHTHGGHDFGDFVISWVSEHFWDFEKKMGLRKIFTLRKSWGLRKIFTRHTQAKSSWRNGALAQHRHLRSDTLCAYTGLTPMEVMIFGT